MKHVILRIAGTFGSGKTTAARDFLTNYPHVPLSPPGAKRPYGYRIEVPGFAAPLFLLGSYHNTCGGCDGIPTQEEIARRALKAHPHGHVLYEGALVAAAGSAGEVTRAVQPTGCAVYTYLDTPLELCIERVKQRRVSAGNAKEFDPSNLVKKFNSVVACYKNMRAEGSYDVRLIDHTDPHPQLLSIIKEYEHD